MLEKAKRGGLTFVGAKRYAKANNKQMGVDSYDPKIESSYITYVDANNLYGWAMVQSLPYKDIKFVPCPPTSVSSGTWCPTLGTSTEPESETLRTRTLHPPTLQSLRPETFRTISEETCPPTLETCPETFRTSSEDTCSATLRTISESCPATLHSIWSETFLSTILQKSRRCRNRLFCRG